MNLRYLHMLCAASHKLRRRGIRKSCVLRRRNPKKLYLIQIPLARPWESFRRGPYRRYWRGPGRGIKDIVGAPCRGAPRGLGI